MPTDSPQTIEIPVKGMDCDECTMHVNHALSGLPGVSDVQVYLAAEKAVFKADPARVSLLAIRQAVKDAGYEVPATAAVAGLPEVEEHHAASPSRLAALESFTRPVLTLLGVVFGAVLFIVVVGEWLGLFEKITSLVPWYLGVAVVLVAGYPVFKNVVRAALNKQVISHTLMTVGVLAALAVGEWATAVVVVFFMRVGDYAEHFTTERARRAVKDLTALAPQKARLERDGQEVEVAVGEVRQGDVVVVRPGEEIPVDGEVISGQATLNQASITGEAMPVEAGPGARVYAATLAQLGSLRLRATAVGADSTFGRVIRLVEEAETHRASVQRVADKFSAYYLPVVAGIALLTFLLRRDPLATAAVLVVACSCSFALATPIAMLASIGAGARRGLLIKGGKYLETLARADVLLVDKTGTLTLGRPQVAEIQPAAGFSQEGVLALAAGAERYSEHPLAEAVRQAAVLRHLALESPQDFQAVPGEGVSARLDGVRVAVGSRRLLPPDFHWPEADALEAQGRTLLFVTRDGQPAGFLAAADTLRPEVGEALQEARRLGIRQVELLTGDNPQSAAALAQKLGVSFRAGLLPEDKIAIVKEYQAQGHVVVMVGDGVNDAPALAQADVGIAMGAAGTDIAIEAAHIALMREDWLLVPQALRIARRTMRVVKTNILFTLVYNLAGLSLAAFGILPPILAAAAQSLPDLGILGNSSRLLR
jgi:Cu+-exporting ATPase